MGRNRIPISKIPNERNRQSTFTKRKAGLIKKAMELSILCDCEVALIIVSGGKKVFPYVSNDMQKTLAKYHELADTGHILTNADYDVINARHNDPPTPSSRPQRNRAHQAGMYSSYDEDMYYSDEEDGEEFPTEDKKKRSGKRSADDSPSQPLPKRKFTLKPGPDPNASVTSDTSGSSPVGEPVQQFSASGRPLRRSTLRDSSSSALAVSQLNSFQSQRASGPTKQEYSSPDTEMNVDPPGPSMPSGSFHHSLPISMPLQQQQQMLQQQQLLQQQQQQDLFNANFAAAAGRPGAMQYVSYPGYGLGYPNSAYGSSYLGAAGGSVLPTPSSHLFPTPGAPSSLGQSMASVQLPNLSSTLNGMTGNSFGTGNGAPEGQLGSASSSSNTNHLSSPSLQMPPNVPSAHRKGASGLSVMVPEVKRTSLISPLTPTLGPALAGGIPMLHSPTLSHSAFFPTLPSPSPTTAPSAFGSIFPPFSSSDFLSLSSSLNSSSNGNSASTGALSTNTGSISGSGAFQHPSGILANSMSAPTATPPMNAAAASGNASSNAANQTRSATNGNPSQASSTPVEIKTS
jgi:hypothetical protein